MYNGRYFVADWAILATAPILLPLILKTLIQRNPVTSWTSASK